MFLFYVNKQSKTSISNIKRMARNGKAKFNRSVSPILEN